MEDCHDRAGVNSVAVDFASTRSPSRSAATWSRHPRRGCTGDVFARLEAARDHFPIEITPNEDQPAVRRLVAPQLGEFALELHVHPLIDELLVHAGHREHAFHAECPATQLQRRRIHVRLVHVERAVQAEAHRRHAVVVHVLAVDVEKLRVHLEHTVELKAVARIFSRATEAF